MQNKHLNLMLTANFAYGTLFSYNSEHATMQTTHLYSMYVFGV